MHRMAKEGKQGESAMFGSTIISTLLEEETDQVGHNYLGLSEEMMQFAHCGQSLSD